MPFRNFDAIMYVDEPPEIEYRSGMFFVRQRYSEKCTIERVMSPATMFRGFQRAAMAIQAYHVSEGEPPDTSAVIHFPRAS